MLLVCIQATERSCPSRTSFILTSLSTNRVEDRYCAVSVRLRYRRLMLSELLALDTAISEFSTKTEPNGVFAELIPSFMKVRGGIRQPTGRLLHRDDGLQSCPSPRCSAHADQY